MVKLGDVCKIIGGYAFKSEEFITDGVPVIRISNLDGETVNVDKNVCYSVEFLKNNNNFTVRKNDILMAMSGATVGKIGVYQNEDVALLNQRVCNLKPIEDKLNREYLNCYCQSDYFKSEILKNAFGCAQPNISVKQIADFEIKILDLKSQVRIANKLKKILCLIEKRKQQLQKLDELVKARFVEMFGDYQSTYLPLIDLIKNGAGLSYGIVQPGEGGTGDMGVVRPVDIVNGKITIENIKYIDRTIGDNFKRTELVGDELLITVRGSTGITALADERFCGMNVTRGIAVIRCDKKKINPVYLNEYLKTDKSQSYIQENTKGATLKQINLSALRVQKIMIPPMELQNKFADFVQQIDKSKLNVQKSLDKLDILKKALMQKYFG